MPGYVQPVAWHLAYPERLLLRDGDDCWFVWTGERPELGPDEIAAATAFWLLRRSWIIPLPPTTAWIHVDDLPLVPNVSPQRPRS